MNGTERVKLSKVIDKMQLTNLTPDVDTSGIWASYSGSKQTCITAYWIL